MRRMKHVSTYVEYMHNDKKVMHNDGLKCRLLRIVLSIIKTENKSCKIGKKKTG